MAHTSRLLAFVIAMLLCFHCNDSIAGNPTSVDTKKDAAEIYTAFLSNWIGDSHSSLNVSTSADIPAPEDIEEYTRCTKEHGSKHVHWARDASDKDLQSIIGNLSYVRLIDPKTWHPHDPSTLIAAGQSVRPAVETGITHGIMRLSTITFNDTHDIAMFTYSSHCGRLCGTGGTVMFNRTPNGWVQNKRSCGGWIS